MIQLKISEITFELRKGDISQQSDMIAVVNAANAELRIGGGVAGAIHRAAGPGLEKECRHLAPIKPGEAVITGAHNLPNKYVIHCLGPIYGINHPEDQLLVKCYRNTLHLADKEGITSIAFPAISTGAFGYPMEEAVSIAIDTIIDMIPRLKSVKKVVVVLYSDDDYQAYKAYLNQKCQS
ncbi:macro domain-containing protein [Lunatibacter salilacus]|uniref:macro domain-containing protein n=1 Tax=Lunatibacter salilacus TaxID=2483804 RepID=UPI00131B95F2|nr:macro domain-containing protein [Lunatibacter salilacus]